LPLSNDDPLATPPAYPPLRPPGVTPPAHAPGTGRRLRIMVGGLALLLLVGFAVVQTLHVRHDRRLTAEAIRQAAAPPPVELVTAGNRAAARALVLPGETAAWYESTIYGRVNGYVGGWSADIGDHVKRGQVLATIETPELDADLAAAKAKLRAADAKVALRQAEAAFAETTDARWRDSPPGVVSEQEREDKKAQDQSAKAQLVAAQAEVNLAQAEFDRLNAFEQFKKVTAPYAGTITERRIDIGNLVSAGSSSQTTLLYRMAQVDPVRVFVDIPQSAATDLMKTGVAVEITSHDLAGRHISGKVTRTSEAIDPKARTFRAEIDLPNPDLALVPGMYVEASFALENSGTVQVPASALSFRSDGPHVALLTAGQKVHFARVAIARDDGSVIELGSGVAAGDKVILNVSNQINEGDAVSVTAIDGKPVVPAAGSP
jgi:RND family efflux transporter MFP subunit